MRGVVTDRVESAGEPDFFILAPHLTGLSAQIADLVGPLPIGGANNTLLQALDSTPQHLGPALYTGVLAIDPFISGKLLFEALAMHGVTGVVNLPTVALASAEFRHALGEAGCDYPHELGALSRARDFGLEAIAFVFSYDQAAQARKLGIDTFIFHPGIPSSDDDRLARLAEAAAPVMERLRSDNPPARVLLYRHPSFAGLLDAAERHADGIVDWAIATGTI